MVTIKLTEEEFAALLYNLSMTTTMRRAGMKQPSDNAAWVSTVRKLNEVAGDNASSSPRTRADRIWDAIREHR